MSVTHDEQRDLLDRLDDPGVLALWVSVMNEMRRRGMVRSDNNPIGDYCEFLVAAHFGVTPEDNSNAGYDLTTEDGERIQVKCRRLRVDGRKPPHFGAVRNLDAEPPPFDHVIGVILNRDFGVAEAWRIPIDRVRHYATYRGYTNSWALPTINQAMRDDPSIEQIELRHAP
jgi:hypothetical protein